MTRTDSAADEAPTSAHLQARPNAVWAGLGLTTFVLAMAFAYPPTLASGDAVLAVAPWLILLAMAVVLGSSVLSVRLVALAVATACWAALLVADQGWTLLAIAIYLLCFTVDPARASTGIAASAVATAAWVAASMGGDSPGWTLVLPASVFATGATLSVALHRTGRMAEEQSALVRSLQATRQDLADAQRARGVLEERARMASEIHDSLAQGFTSIVLLARGASRSSGAAGAAPTSATAGAAREARSPDAAHAAVTAMAAGLAEIEQAAQESLAEARRIVAASEPPELHGSSLHDALQRHVDGRRSEGLRIAFRIAGQPRRAPGEVEVTVLRALQEALRNVEQHADTAAVAVTLSWLDDRIVLDVRDEGSGFAPGAVQDRGGLTGGQGLVTLARRVEALGGTVVVESAQGEGTTVSTRLPVGAP